jgi:transposase
MSDILVSGEDRRQELFLPKMLDDYVEEDNEVRFIEAFVNWLNMIALGFKHAEPCGGPGRAPYDPRDLLKLYIWGYLNGVRSSRKLERECLRDLEVMWLMRNLTPDFKTIADFRKDNIDAIKPVFRMFVQFLQSVDLIEGKLASLDGTKIKAWNSKKRNFNAAKLALKLKSTDEQSENYLKELEENDKKIAEEENNETKKLLEERAAYIKKRRETLAERKEQLNKMSEKLAKSGQTEISLTDPDSRQMKNNQRVEICYNAQASVDRKEKLIVDYDVINESNDRHQLAPRAISTKKALGVEKLDVVADSGFATPLQLKECVENGITPYIPADADEGGAQVPDPASFGIDKFLYNKEKDFYVCPAGNEMNFRYVKNSDHGKRNKIYRTSKCEGCPFRSRCTTSKEGRIIRRWESQEIIDEIKDRVRHDPEKMVLRQELAEHPFGTVKRNFNQGYFLMKGLTKVRGEFGFTVLAYDIRRALNILDVGSLIDALANCLIPTIRRVY